MSYKKVNAYNWINVYRKSSIKSRVLSANYSKKDCVKLYKPAYDTTVTPEELRNQNLYVQTIQQRVPSSLASPVPSLHPNYQFSKQKHVGGGGIIVETRLLPNFRKVNLFKLYLFKNK